MGYLQKYDNNIYLFFLLCILLSVAALFLWNINDHGFWKDELYHALGGKFILTEGKPIFPTGEIYNRAIGYTYMVALSYKIFGISELAARFPSFLFMIIFLITSGYFVRRQFGTFPALLFLLIMALSPLSIELMRFCRLYTTFAFFYFFAAWSFFFGFERITHEQKSGFWSKPLFGVEIKAGINLKLLLLSGILFLISFHMHRLTMTFAVVLGGYICLKFLDRALEEGILQALWSKYGLIFLLGIAGILGMFMFYPEFLIGIKEKVSYKMIWAKEMEFNSSFYRVFLSESYPFFFFAYPVAAIYLIQKHKNIGLFLLANFLVLFLLHSFVIEMKQLRYFHYVLPFFFMTVVLFAVELVKYIWNHFEKMPRFNLFWVKGSCLIAILVFLNVFTFPWLNEGKNVPRKHPDDANWKTFSQKAIPLMDSQTPVLATDQLVYLFYFGKKPDYYMRLNYHEVPNDTAHFAGSSPITSFEELRDLSEREPKLYIVTKRRKLNYYVYSNEAIRQYIEENFDPIDLGEIDDIRLYQKKN